MNWKRLSEDSIGTLAQRAIKIGMIKADRVVVGARMAVARIVHGKGFFLKEVQGSKMFLNLGDKGLSADLYLRGKREDKATDEFQARLKKGMVIADIGANIGYYALMEALWVGPKGKVYAIEPVSENIELLNRNIAANGYQNIEVFEKAIGDKDTKKDLILSRQSNLSSFCGHIDLDHSGEKRSVELQTLDSFLQGKRKPDFVRMDVEGYEFEIMLGMKKTIKEAGHLQLFIEVHADFMGKEKTVEFYRILKKSGVRKCLIVWDSMDVLKLSEKIVSKDILPEQGRFEKTIEEMIKEEKFHHGLYHLFAET